MLKEFRHLIISKSEIYMLLYNTRRCIIMMMFLNFFLTRYYYYEHNIFHTSTIHTTWLL